jgi:RNA recognition motif-containing protein
MQEKAVPWRGTAFLLQFPKSCVCTLPAYVLALKSFPRNFPLEIPPQRSGTHHRMSNTVFLGNLPAWVTADDIKSWLSAENLVADSIKVIRNPETQESKGFAFIEAPNVEEMNSIIRRFDRAPLEDRMLRANPAQPPKSKSGVPVRAAGPMTGPPPGMDRNKRPRPNRDAAGGPPAAKRKSNKPQSTSAFAEELAKAL